MSVVQSDILMHQGVLGSQVRHAAIGTRALIRVPGTGEKCEFVQGVRVGDDGLYEIESIPTMTPRLGFKDQVETFPDGNGGLELILVIKESAYSVFALLPVSEDEEMEIRDLLCDHFYILQDDTGQFQYSVNPHYRMFSIAALPSCFNYVSTFLKAGERQGRWSYGLLADRANLADADPRWDGI